MRKLMGGLSSPLMPTINVYTNFLLSPRERPAAPRVCVLADNPSEHARARPPRVRARTQAYRRTIQEQGRDGVIRKAQAQMVRARARASM